MKPGIFQGKKFPFTPKRRKKSLGSQCNNIIDTRHDLAAFRSKLANVSWLRSYNCDIVWEGKILGFKCVITGEWEKYACREPLLQIQVLDL